MTLPFEQSDVKVCTSFFVFSNAHQEKIYLVIELSLHINNISDFCFKEGITTHTAPRGQNLTPPPPFCPVYLMTALIVSLRENKFFTDNF